MFQDSQDDGVERNMKFLSINSMKLLVVTWNTNGRIEEKIELKNLFADGQLCMNRDGVREPLTTQNDGDVHEAQSTPPITFSDCQQADLVVVGLQEIISLSTSNVISSSITNQYTLQSERVEGWRVNIAEQLKSIKFDFELVCCTNMVGLWLGTH